MGFIFDLSLIYLWIYFWIMENFSSIYFPGRTGLGGWVLLRIRGYGETTSTGKMGK